MVHTKTGGTLSDTIAAIPFPGTGTTATIRALTSSLDRFAVQVAVFAFAALNLIPAPPGLSLFLGIPLVICAYLQVANQPLWLPGFVLDMSFRRETFERQRSAVLRWLERADRWTRQSWNWPARPAARLPLDLAVLVLSLSVLIPLPFTAMLPSFAICVITFGRLEKDGRLVAGGLLAGAAAAMITMAMLIGAIRLIGLVAHSG